MAAHLPMPSTFTPDSTECNNDEEKWQNVLDGSANVTANVTEILMKDNIHSHIRQEVSSSLQSEKIHLDTENVEPGSHNENTISTALICFNCAEKQHFKSGHDICLGMHIVFGRYMSINKLNEEIKKCFKFLADKLGIDQIFFYEHHAIVSEVIETSDTTAKVKLIEFTSLGYCTFKVVESGPTTMDINDKELSFKKYKRCKYTPDEIVSRARTLVGESAYNLLSNNCEHVAMWCVSGNNVSFQAENIIDKRFSHIIAWLASVVMKVAAIVSIDDVYITTRCAKYAMLAVPCLAFAGVYFIIELLITIFRLVDLKKQEQQEKICRRCYNRRRVYQWGRISTSVLGTLALALIPCTSHSVLICTSVVLGIASMFIIPKFFSAVYRKIKMAINPLYDTEKVHVRSHNEIQAGDVLTIPVDHDVIVKKVTFKQKQEQTGKIVHLWIVHFGWNFGHGRIVTKEQFTFDLNQKRLSIFDIPGEISYSDKEVVNHALEKLGNKNFSPLTYRSSHMSKTCKVKNYEAEYHHSTASVPSTKRLVKQWSEVKPGDMIEFCYYGLPHVGIVVEKLHLWIL